MAPAPAPLSDAQNGGSSDAAARIDAAIARIEAAVAVRTSSAEALAKRHAQLKKRMVEAVKALDDVIARGPAD